MKRTPLLLLFLLAIFPAASAQSIIEVKPGYIAVVVGQSINVNVTINASAVGVYRVELVDAGGVVRDSTVINASTTGAYIIVLSTTALTRDAGRLTWSIRLIDSATGSVLDSRQVTVEVDASSIAKPSITIPSLTSEALFDALVTTVMVVASWLILVFYGRSFKILLASGVSIVIASLILMYARSAIPVWCTVEQGVMKCIYTSNMNLPVYLASIGFGILLVLYSILVLIRRTWRIREYE